VKESLVSRREYSLAMHLHPDGDVTDYWMTGAGAGYGTAKSSDGAEHCQSI
jgi:hypothetical protein